MVARVLRGPTHVVIGAGDVETTSAFLAAFGFTTTGRSALPAEAALGLYGICGITEEVLLEMPGAASGWLRVVRTPEKRVVPTPPDDRPLWPRLFTNTVDTSVEAVRAAGWTVFDPIDCRMLDLGNVRQALAVGPEFLRVGLVESARRGPSILDTGLGALHSEIASVSWAVGGYLGAAASFWRNAGLTAVAEGDMDGNALPEPFLASRTVRVVELADEDCRPPVLELVDLGSRAHVKLPTWPLRPGLHAVAFSTDDLQGAMAGLPDVAWGTVVQLETPLHPATRATTGITPGGVRLELWETLTH